MKALSAVIVVILMLMISISLAAFAYMFFMATASITMESGTEMVEQTTSSMLAKMKIDSISDNKVYIRNIGNVDLTGFSVYVNNEKVNISAPISIAPDQVDSITIYGFIKEDDSIKVTTARGVMAIEKAPDPCDSSSVVLCLKFDEGSGSIAYDSSKYNNDGGLVGSPSWVQGKYGSALEFSGGNWVDFTCNYFPTGPSPHTISAWVYYDKIDGVWTEQGVIAFGTTWASYQNRFLFVRSRNLAVAYGNNDYISPYPVPTGKWIFITWVYNTTHDLIYVNGELVGIRLSGTVNTVINNDHFVGHSAWGGNFDGKIDEVRVYNKAIY